MKTGHLILYLKYFLVTKVRRLMSLVPGILSIISQFLTARKTIAIFKKVRTNYSTVYILAPYLYSFASLSYSIDFVLLATTSIQAGNQKCSRHGKFWSRIHYRSSSINTARELRSVYTLLSLVSTYFYSVYFHAVVNYLNIYYILTFLFIITLSSIFKTKAEPNQVIIMLFKTVLC